MRRIRALLVLALAPWGAGAVSGVELFEALERAPLVVVGRTAAPRALDDQARAVELEVESVLRGPTSRGARLSLAWEELSPAREARFAAGERLLVCLEPLPAHSLWAARIRDPEQRVRTLTPALRGEAYVRDPRPGSLRTLEHYLALPPERRAGDPGVAHLALLAVGAGPRLAVAAIRALDRVPELDAALDPASAERLVAAGVGDDPERAEALLELLRSRRPGALRVPLQARAAPDASGPFRAYAGLAALDGPLAAPLAEALLARADSPAHRRVGARHADASLASRLARELRRDPDAGVRAAALERLVESEGLAALDRALFALDDPDAGVRAAAMQAIGELGEPAVPELRAVVEHGSLEAARTAVGALRACGSAGARALQEIADGHPDPSVRMLAGVAIGREIGHVH